MANNRVGQHSVSVKQSSKTAQNTMARRKALRAEHEEVKQSDLVALVAHLREHPKAYAAGFVFLVIAVLSGFVYRQVQGSRESEINSAVAKALTAEPGEQFKALDAIDADGSPAGAYAVYMKGEAAFRENKLEAARKAFEQVRSEFPKSEVAPNAVDGLGAIAEVENKPEDALKLYEEVVTKWPESFVALREPYKIGRIHEQMGNVDKAVTAYRDQVANFPGSQAAMRADEELNRLRESHPDLFPDALILNETPEATETAATTPAVESPQAEAVETPSSSEGTPESTAPVADVPADEPTADSSPEVQVTPDPTERLVFDSPIDGGPEAPKQDAP